jgi:hypothetical protein
MPYILEEYRKDVLKNGPDTPGELNYFITYHIQKYLGDKLRHDYTAFNEVIGALESAKLEFYRRVVVPYEEQKRFDNGDVYDL